MTAFPWEAAFSEAVHAGSVPELVTILHELRTDHAGTPNVATKTRALKLIRRALGGQAERLYRVAAQLADAQSHAAQELGAALLAEQYALHPSAVVATLCRLADSENWEVREWVASACGQVLTDHFAQFYPTMQAWCGHPSGNVRRAVAVAVKYAALGRETERGEPLLQLAEQLLADRDPYVRKNLGPFAIGDGLLRCYPAETLARLRLWVGQEDDQVRWNVAMAFAGAEGARHPAAARELLGRLEADPRRTVRQAVQTALRNLEKRAPGAAEPAR